MSNIATEGVSGVQVYKTSKASIQSGGIGSSINLSTVKPFDNKGFVGSVGVKAVRDMSTRIGEKITPELSGFASWSNDMFGASVSYSIQDRNSSQAGVFTNNWADFSKPYVSGADFFGNGTAGDVVIENAPAVNTQANHTPGVRYHYGDYDRKRENGHVTLQFSPNDRFTATLDHMEAQQDLSVNSSEFSFWFGGGSFPATNARFDGNSQAATPIYFWGENQNDNNGDPTGAATGNVRDIGVTQNSGSVRNFLKSTGLNLAFEANDSLSFTFDVHRSESKSLPGDGAIGNNINIGLGIQGVYAQGFVNEGDLPLLIGAYEDRYTALDANDNGLVDVDMGEETVPVTDVDYGVRDGGLFPGFVDVADLGSTVRQINNDRSWADMTEIQLAGKFETDEYTIDFGIQSAELEATQRGSFSQIVLEGNWGVGTPGDVPPSMIRELDYAQLFDGYSTSLTDEQREWFDNAGTADPRTGADHTGQAGEVMTQGFIANDVAELGRILSRNNGLPWAPADADSINRTITEETTAAFVQFSADFEFGSDLALDVQAGLRYETTDIESFRQVGLPSFIWQGDNDFSTVAGPASAAPAIIESESYDYVLPNLDVALSFNENMVVRASLSKTIARADFDKLQEGIAGVQPPRGGPTILDGTPGDANEGFVGLLPIESNNLDLSYEWYYGEASYLSVGYFWKDVSNFIGSEPTIEAVPDVYDPSNGPRAQAAIDELNARGIAVTQQTLFQMIASQNLVPEACVDNPSRPLGSASCGATYEDFPYAASDNTGWENAVDILAVSSGAFADPLSVNRVARPVNTEDAKLDGWEFGVQHFFGDTGFGFQANYTLVDGDIEYDITGSPTTTQFALSGLSDSANLVLIYEKDRLSARIAYNWRDDFLESPTETSNEPSQREAYEQVDFNVSYAVTDNLNLSLEGINVFEQDLRQYARTESQLRRLEIYGARYALNARYSF